MKNLFFKNYCRKFLIFFALSIVVATLTFSLCACDDNTGGDNQPIEIVSSNYEFSADLSPEGKTEFYFTPQFSGDYVVSVNDENATFLIDGVEISEKTVYFSKKEKYDIVFLSSQKNIKGLITPQQVVETTMYVRKENDFVVKYVPKKSGTYLIDLFDEKYYLAGDNNNTTEITVYDKNFDKLDELQSRTYFFQQDEKERCYYIVVNNFNKYLDISLDLTIGKVDSRLFVFSDYDYPYFYINGEAGDIVYLYLTSSNIKDIILKLHLLRAKIGVDITIDAFNGNKRESLISNTYLDGNKQCVEFSDFSRGFKFDSYVHIQGDYFVYTRLKIEFINAITVELSK